MPFLSASKLQLASNTLVVFSKLFFLQRQIFHQSRKWFEWKFPCETSIILRLKVALENLVSLINDWKYMARVSSQYSNNLICSTSITFMCLIFYVLSVCFFSLLVYFLHLVLLKENTKNIKVFLNIDWRGAP